MSKQGGPAFPTRNYSVNGDGSTTPFDEDGMTLRDYFAAKAMQAFLTDHVTHYGHGNHWDAKDLASSAYDLADAMLAARKGGNDASE